MPLFFQHGWHCESGGTCMCCIYDAANSIDYFTARLVRSNVSDLVFKYDCHILSGYCMASLTYMTIISYVTIVYGISNIYDYHILCHDIVWHITYSSLSVF